MSVLATAYSVVVHRRDLEELYPGGERGFEQSAGWGYCSDGEICRAAFNSSEAAWSFAERLAERTGMVFEERDTFIDIAVIDGRSGPLRDCDWLAFGIEAGGIPVVRHPLDTADAPARPARGSSVTVHSLPLPVATSQTGLHGGHRYERPADDESTDDLYTELLNALAGLMVSHFNSREQARADGREAGVDEFDLKLRGLVTEIGEITARHGETSLHGLYVLGLANCFAGFWHEGEHLLQRCTRLAPRFSAGWEALAFCAQMMGHFEAAMCASRRLRSLEPGSALACHYHAESLEALGRYDEALSVAMDAVAMDSSGLHRMTLERIADIRLDAQSENGPLG